MEAIEESQVHCTVDAENNVGSDSDLIVSMEADSCHKSNGVAAPVSAGCSATVEPETHSQDPETVIPQTDNVFTDSGVPDTVAIIENVDPCQPEAEIIEAMETAAAVANLFVTTASKITEVIAEGIEDTGDSLANEIATEESTVKVESLDKNKDKVTFETEILVEKHNDDGTHEPLEAITNEHDNANNILSELGQSIELSDVLRSSDTTDNVENNNSGRQEVFNKEELLDILEGNDMATSDTQVSDILLTVPDSKKDLEAQKALNQLTRLKNSRNKRSKSNDKSTRRKGKKRLPKPNEDIENTSCAEQNTSLEESMETVEDNSNTPGGKQSESIVNVLVKDWDDDEHSDIDQPIKLEDQSVKSQETVTSQEEGLNRSSIDSPSCESQNVSLNKSGDESQPQRRLGRVIKKKVIFDPDNPDTFTKGKVVKNKESPIDKEQTPSKKIKIEEKQRSKSKSPTAKMAWKKPQPKNSSKQHKRLTEVDKLLMDEGAVNMIYQLTSEAPKGKKNMRTKAEFIKKIQSSTPEGKEMKFRERKKETLRTDEAKTVLGGKRSSLSGSVKSPSVCEDFETHSADDSIIYRRHSSSSYSSTCMSPRRLSDVDAGAAQSAARASRQASDTQTQLPDVVNGDQVEDVFMAEVPTNEIINKDDCLSIKEKLNSKLSLALNKRKRENTKGEKSSKQKKISKSEGKEENVKLEKINSFKYVSVNFDQRVAEISIGKKGSTASIEMLKELQQMLEYVDSIKDVPVTLLTSECGTLCSDLDLRPLLNATTGRSYAYELAESVRGALCAAERHSKVLVAGAWGACAGVALALVALSDIAMASEGATFTAGAPLLPGVAALTARCHRLPHSLLNELVLLGRSLSSSEAVQCGLVGRALWAERAPQHALEIARDVATQPAQSLLLKKQLLNLKKGSGADQTFLSSLEKERDLLVQYWTSDEGQEVLRATLGL